ncbi:hypothetical protein EV278_12340 [Caulobacter sp. BK020]|nr:hypothetical protein EV278_12340 [Caulobacter sp. BK020]
MLADPAMVPPVALLVYASDDPARASFWPFAVYSPEYQAACWAVRNGAIVRFIDVPAAWNLAPPAEPASAPETESTEGANAPPPLDEIAARLERDPIGLLAEAGGYQDGESWWRDVIEESPASEAVFAAVADAMAALRSAAPAAMGREALREAHMRLEIAKAARDSEGAVAVVCGAWHEPALKAKIPLSQDRDLVKGAPRQKISATWAPWTSPRLAFQSGYAAGVAAPGWCGHLWETPRQEVSIRWLGRIARALREAGHIASTASLIEAQRLAVALASMRDRPHPGFEELREAAIACLCDGERLVWETIAAKLLLGDAVGEISPDAPLAPLIEDLQREQRRTRLKPEALERELAIDLRSESGLDRSTLLHRLSILDVPWGRQVDAGRSRGTFRERWQLRWEPEFAVRLVENLVYGPTLARAAAGRLTARFAEATDLPTLCSLTLSALTAQLPDAAHNGVERIEHRVALTSDCGELLSSLAPLGDIVRYGQARRTDAVQLETLFGRILSQGALALPYAARGLDAEAAKALRSAVLAADAAAVLAEAELTDWRGALSTVAYDEQTTPLLAGVASRLLYEADKIAPEAAADLLGRMLSPGRTLAEAAGFFEGFFDSAGERLIYDEGLRAAVDHWMLALEEDDFTAFLPLFRRALGNLDRMQRRRLLEAIFGRGGGGLQGRVLAADAEAVWPAHLQRLTDILTARPAT